MTKVLIMVIAIFFLPISAAADELTAPEVLRSGVAMMPQNTDSFADALRELVQNGINRIQPELKIAANTNMKIILSSVLLSLLAILSDKITVPVSIAGTVMIAAAMFQNTNTMVNYAAETVRDICEYGKLLCPVLTTALAAQGGITSSAALYTGTAAFIALLGVLVSRWMIPMIYLYLVFSMAGCALGEKFFRKFADAINSILHWLLKTILIVFTTYMSITGVISGLTDVAALKTAKLTMSTVVPIVGGILSDASEAVLVSLGLIKNTAGIYGILATLAVFMGPFIKVGVQYLFLKFTALICSLFPGKNLSELAGNFSTAMGLLLAMIASSCTLVFISTVCFLKGIG